MINLSEVIETNKMILEENLDVRTITMGVSLLDCADSSLKKTCDNIYAKLMRLAKDLVRTGDDIGREFGVPVVNKRISVTPAAIVGSACCRTPGEFVKIAAANSTVTTRIITGFAALPNPFRSIFRAKRCMMHILNIAVFRFGRYSIF